MILNIVLTLVFFSNHQLIEGHFDNTDSAKYKQDLIEIIKALNYVETDKNEVKIIRDTHKDNSDELSDGEKEKKLQEILQLLKRNYNGKKHYDDLLKNPVHSGARLYFIKNPDVLDEYRNYLKRKKILPLNSEEVDFNGDDREESKESKRRSQFRTASTELSEANDFDRAESLEYKEPINETPLETTQTLLSDYAQEKQPLIDDDTVQIQPEKIDLKDVVKEILSKTNDETNIFPEEHNSRAKNDNSFVRREKIDWVDSNEKIDKDISIKQVQIEKPYKAPKKKEKKHKKSDDRREKRIYDEPVIERDDRREKRIYDKPVIERDDNYKRQPKFNYRKPKIDSKRDYFSYGRTSIPFIGKKGIYDDK
ncbi:DNA ligase 1-like [Vanessa cardui]|uniref:DNA ligase 1-like n=1 Tax=Vanessa cardui TaxID=171605 RepID=UPI001F12B96C|nr:DNA ligase 1-like [Vanessa cardui]